MTDNYLWGEARLKAQSRICRRSRFLAESACRRTPRGTGLTFASRDVWTGGRFDVSIPSPGSLRRLAPRRPAARTGPDGRLEDDGARPVRAGALLRWPAPRRRGPGPDGSSLPEDVRGAEKGDGGS